MTYNTDDPIDGNPAVSGNSDLTVRAYTTLDYRSSDFSWEQAIRVLKKNKRFGLAVFGVVIAATITVVMLMRNVYEPAGTIEIAPPSSGIRTLHEIESPPEVEYQDYLETQTQILQSDALAVSVIRQLELDKRTEFAGWHSAAQEQGTAAGAASEAADGGKAFLQQQRALSTLTPSEAVALDAFRRDLSVNPIRNTRLVEVSFASHDPRLAREVANEVITKFIENDYKQRYNTTTQASEWLSSQLSGLYQKVIASNQAVSDYQRKFGLVEMDDRDVPLSQLMGEVNHQLSEAQAARIENEAYLRMIDAGQVAYVPTIRDDKVYQDLLVRQGDLRTQLAQAKAVYGDENINVKKLQDQLEEVGKELGEQRARIVDGIRTAYSAAKEREELMLGNREKLRAQMVNVNSQLVGYRVLKSEAVANSDLYNTLQARLKEAGIYAGLGSSNIRVVGLAENLQSPTGPHRKALIAIGSLASFLLGILACFVKESLNNTVRTPEDAKAWAGLKSLALLPAMRSAAMVGKQADVDLGRSLSGGNLPSNGATERPITFMRPLTAEAEAMRDLRTSLTCSGRRGGLNVVLISSAMEGEGKTTVAVNFAVAMAQVGRTCLVDGDLRQPVIAQAFGIDSAPGLSGVLNGSADLSNALAHIGSIPGLWVLPSGRRVESPADTLASPAMQVLLAALRKQFQFVVIDSAPIIRFSDARYLSQLADEVVLIGRYGITTRRAIQRSAELLQDVHAPLAGIVLNGIDYSSPDYHYFMYGYSRAAEKRNRYSSVSSSTLFGGPGDGSPPKSKGAHA
ncbi:MAG TPA: polysaccharide biosynthesis tyrosine autokinase [Verrucomicrobiae bacterium]|nr:polysaccharide biosynthesis tyrosine autokinase [Verrucomicrobiae bacterium]